MSTALPQISCVTVSTDRLMLLKEAIACYCTQTYPNRELVIVSGGSARYRTAVAAYLRWLDRDDIVLVAAEEGDSLGRMRNLTLDHSHGEIVCQWDDDDLYHPERVRLQYEGMEREQAQACFLTEHLQFLVEARAMYWIDWLYHTGAPDEDWVVPGTLMMRKDPRFRYPESGGEASIGEDNAIRHTLFQNVKVAALRNLGYLYVYRFHGRNVMPAHHHQRITAWGSLDLDVVERRGALLRRVLPSFPLPLPYTVFGRGGKPVLTFNGFGAP